MPYRIRHLLSILHDRDHRVRKESTRHRHTILPGDHVKEQWHHHRNTYGQKRFLTHCKLFELKKPSPAAMVPILLFSTLRIPKALSTSSLRIPKVRSTSLLRTPKARSASSLRITPVIRVSSLPALPQAPLPGSAQHDAGHNDCAGYDMNYPHKGRR